MNVPHIHPERRVLGVHVAVASVANLMSGRCWEVVEADPQRQGFPNRTLSAHRTLQAACARARWHSGTRFVFVECPDEQLCWDGLLGRCVSWDAAYMSMSLDPRDPGRSPDCLASGAHLGRLIVGPWCVDRGGVSWSVETVTWTEEP